MIGMSPIFGVANSNHGFPWCIGGELPVNGGSEPMVSDRRLPVA
jgi:hypothetical protein